MTQDSRPLRRGVCIIDADRTLLERPCLDATLDAIGLPPHPGPTDRRTARLATQLLAGTPVATLEKVAHRVRFRPQAVETVQALQAAGYAVAIFASGMTQTMRFIGQRLGADEIAGIDAQTRYDRLTGRIEATWEGDCDRPVCGKTLAQAMRRRVPGHVAIIDDADPCLDNQARLLDFNQLDLMADPWLAVR